ncbi:MAG: archease [Deltaproteobacteria bacterium]
MRRRPYRFLPHTADLMVEARGKDLPELFSRCAIALFSLITDRRFVRSAETRTVSVAAEVPEDRLYLLLRDALLLFSAGGFLARTVNVTMKGNSVTLSAAGEPADFSRHPAGREVKAVTAHAMTIRKTPDGVVARYVVDI